MFSGLILLEPAGGQDVRTRSASAVVPGATVERKVGWCSDSRPCCSSLARLGGDHAEPYSRLTPESSELPAESQGRGEALAEAGG